MIDELTGSFSPVGAAVFVVTGGVGRCGGGGAGVAD